MADLDWSEVLALDAGLSSVPVLAQQLVLEHVNETVDPAMFGGEDSKTFKLARAALGAHLARFAVPGEAAAPGPVASKSVGGLSKSYAAFAGSDPSMLAETRWGRTFLSLARNSAARAGLVI